MEKDEKKDKKPKSNLLKRKQKEKQEQIPESDVEVREVIVEKKTGFNTIEVVLIAILALAFGGVVGVVSFYILCYLIVRNSNPCWCRNFQIRFRSNCTYCRI